MPAYGDIDGWDTGTPITDDMYSVGFVIVPDTLTSCPPILAISNKQGQGDYHWRIDRPLTRLRESGVDAQICWLDGDQMPTAPVAGRVVVLQRVIVNGDGPEAARAWTDRLRAAGALAIVYELDDDELTGAEAEHIAAIPGDGASRTHLAADRQALRWMLAACDGATVTTEPLAAVVRQYSDRPVIVVPNAIDVGWFRERLPTRAPWADHLTIGWAGWRRPDADLEPMAVAWGRIAARYPDVRFVVAGHQAGVIYRQPIDLDRIIRVPVAKLDEYPAMYQVDIGCCAVADSPFSRCKTPIKAWECALAGAVTIGTPMLYFDHVAAVAVDATDWEDHIAAFIEEGPTNRRQFARERALDVERDHSLSTQLHRWTDAYASIVDATHGKIGASNASA